jgi:hypothetical protein
MDVNSKKVNIFICLVQEFSHFLPVSFIGSQHKITLKTGKSLYKLSFFNCISLCPRCSGSIRDGWSEKGRERGGGREEGAVLQSNLERVIGCTTWRFSYHTREFTPSLLLPLYKFHPPTSLQPSLHPNTPKIRYITYIPLRSSWSTAHCIELYRLSCFSVHAVSIAFTSDQSRTA